jgi:IS5 family transposase
LVPQRPEWRTGCEGRISVAKRRHGLNRCRYRGDVGIKRRVGLGVFADNLISVGICKRMHTRLTPLAFAAASFLPE